MQLIERFHGAVEISEHGERPSAVDARRLCGDGAKQLGYARRLGCHTMLALQEIQDLLLEFLNAKADGGEPARAAAAHEDVALRDASPSAEQLNCLDPRVPHKFRFASLAHVPTSSASSINQLGRAA